ncbi:hypothetical protein FQ154_16805 [Paeniglutamicibacter gangotriensis]|nr:hypothetical protein [Paeniglutamicibacter gangotriensis]KAA0974096.1 hypothetical protein FQ154_16805 [Paeniglutamicibacter gangotriensis]
MAPTEPGPGLGGDVMLAPILGALAVLAAASTVWLVKTRPTTQQDPDAAFWYVFAGVSLVFPLFLGVGLINRWFGLATLAMVAATILATNRFSSNALQRRQAGEQASLISSEHSALAIRHASVLTAWSRYELDPAAAIAHPNMNDVNAPATAELARALAAAEAARTMGTGYRQAVAGLEAAFRRAEKTQAQVIDGLDPHHVDI